MPDETIRQRVTAALDLVAFGHDLVNGSWQIPPDAADVHEAGIQLTAALAILDASERDARSVGVHHGAGCYRWILDPQEPNDA